MSRRLTGEKRERRFVRNGTLCRIEYSWHHTENGDRYHYIHVYRGLAPRLPFRWWRWFTDDDGNFIGWG